MRRNGGEEMDSLNGTGLGTAGGARPWITA